MYKIHPPVEYHFKSLMNSSMVVVVDGRKYVFNCPDGLQRTLLAHEDFKFKRAGHVFLSSNSPAYRAGFPGFYLSARESLRQHAR